jgi:PAS domain S-box-containing protein
MPDPVSDIRPWPLGGGEMGGRIRAHDWARTPLGPVEAWPQSLRTAVDIMLGSPSPVSVTWGPEHVQLYNDAYVPLAQERHPELLGRPALEGWAEVRDFLAPLLAGVVAGGPPVVLGDRRVALRRAAGDGVEERVFTATFSAVHDESGAVGGVFNSLQETTEAARALEALRGSVARHEFLLALGDRLRPLTGPAEVLDAAARALGEHLGASRVGYALEQEAGETVAVAGSYADGVPDIKGRPPYPDYGPELLRELRAGRSVVRPHAAGDATLSPAEEEAHAALQPGATVHVPLLKADRLVAVLFVHHREARAWSADELALLEAVAERTWDAVERARAEAALRESEARFRLMADAVPQIVWITDDAGRVEFFNRQWTAYTGRPYEPTTASEVAATAVHPDDAALTVERFDEARRTGGAFRVEHRIRSAAGEYRWFLVRGEPFRDPATGEIVRWFGASVDIHDRRLAEAERERLLAALETERSRLVEVIRRAPAFMVVLRGPRHVLELVNDAYQQLIGHRDVVGRPLFDAVPEARGQGFEELLDAVLATGEPFVGRALPITLQRTPGAPPEERILDLAYVPLTEPDGSRSGIVVLGTDVTEQVRGRREIERARDRAERLQALTAALAGARTVDDVADVVVSDMVVALGARTGALAGRAPGDDSLVLLRTVGFPEPVPAGVQRQGPELRTPLVECFRTRAPLWIEGRAGPDGLDARYPPIAPVWDALGVASAVFVPLVAAGETVGVISFGFDAPRAFEPEERDFLLALGRQAALAVERARLFEAEHAARAEAERANRAKSEFLAVMSHELRTPLNAIGGYAELMEMGIRGPITPQQRQDLHRIQQSQRHLLGLINEVLNYARLETGTVHYDVADVSMREAMAAAEALVAPQAHAKELALAVAPCPPGIAARADAEKTRQILVNLLSNAVKFTDRGGRVEVACAASGDRVLVHVRDTGIGIAADQLERIFEPFVQVRADLTRTAEGTGLGLAISRDLARGMGGDLTAVSAPGAGSTFTLALPRAQDG